MKRPAAALETSCTREFRSFVAEVFNTKFAHHLFYADDKGNVHWPGRVHTFRKCFQLLEEKRRRSHNHSFLLLETGTCRDATFEKDPEAPGLWTSGASTIMLDAFVNFYDGAVYSWDLNKDTQDKARKHLSDKTVLMNGDSVAGLNAFLTGNGGTPDLLYLDSFDLCWLQPEPSGEHHMKELCCAVPFLTRGSIVLVDDSPNQQGLLPPWVDKGTLVQHDVIDQATARRELVDRIGKELERCIPSKRSLFTALKTAAASDTSYQDLRKLFLESIPGTSEFNALHGASELLPGKGYLVHEYMRAIGVPEDKECAGYQLLYVWP